MTYQQAVHTALDVQDACDLSSVLADPVMDPRWEDARRTGQETAFIREHPIVTLFIGRLESVNPTQCMGRDHLDNFGWASARVVQLDQTTGTRQEEETWEK